MAPHDARVRKARRARAEHVVLALLHEDLTADDRDAGDERRRPVPALAKPAPLGDDGRLDRSGDGRHQSNRTLGSRSAWARSAVRYTSTTMTAKARVTACTTGKSRWKIELII